MNRQARRRASRFAREKELQWGKVVPKGSFSELGDNDGRALLTHVFRIATEGSPSDNLDDEALFDSTMDLIRHGLLDIWFAIDGTGLHVKVETRQLQEAFS